MLEDISHAVYHNAQSSIRPVRKIVVEQFMLNFIRNKDLCKGNISVWFDAQIPTLFYVDMRDEKVSNQLLTSTLFMDPIARFVRCKTDKPISWLI